jgi:hypothetical protein
MNCPKCNCEACVLIGGFWRCPECYNYFKPTKPLKFNCPSCAQPLEIESEVDPDQTVTCPHCQVIFNPTPRQDSRPSRAEIAAAAAIHEQLLKTISPAPSPPKPISVVDSGVRGWAEIISGLAKLLFVLGIAMGLITLFIGISESEIRYPGVIIMGVFWTLALWLGLFAQVMHIRANTEK